MNHDSTILSSRHAVLLFTILFLFTSTNYVPLSAVPSAIAIVLFPLVIFTQYIPNITYYSIFYYAISLFSAAIYDPRSFINYDFYRYDGNFILSYAPTLALPLLRARWNIERTLKISISIMTLVSAVGLCVKFSLGLSIANGLFIADNAFGGFLMFTLGFSLVWFYYERATFVLFILCLNIIMMYISYSRGSELAVIAAVIATVSINKGRSYIPILMVIFVVTVESIILWYTYPIYVHLDLERHIYKFIGTIHPSTKVGNVLIRAFENWPRGLYDFLHSPIFGGGFGSVNDVPLKFSHAVSVFQLNQSHNYAYNDSSAHNTYIQILAEQGIFGLTVFILFWTSIHSFIRDSIDIPIIRNTLMISFWSLTFASFTEVRIQSGSNEFPFMICLLLYYSYISSIRRLP